VQDYREFVPPTATKWVPVGFEQGPSHPAVECFLVDAKKFCRWLTDQERRAEKNGAAQEYRLADRRRMSWQPDCRRIREHAERKEWPSGKYLPWAKRGRPRRAATTAGRSFFKKYLIPIT